MIVIETERLALREATLDDAAFFAELLSEPLYRRFIADRGDLDSPAARAYLEERVLSAYRLHGFGQYLVTLKADGAPIGTAGMIRREGVPDPDLGYAILARRHGNGYAAEAGAGVLTHARDVLGLKRALAFTDRENQASKAVLRKLGFRYTGTGEHPIIGETSFFEKNL